MFGLKWVSESINIIIQLVNRSLKKFLDSQQILQVAAIFEGRPWICSAYFVNDEKLANNDKIAFIKITLDELKYWSDEDFGKKHFEWIK